METPGTALLGPIFCLSHEILPRQLVKFLVDFRFFSFSLLFFVFCSRQMKLLHCCPPPLGFETFFAKVEQEGDELNRNPLISVDWSIFK